MQSKKETVCVLFSRGVKVSTKQYLEKLAETTGYTTGYLVDVAVELLKKKEDARKTRTNKKNSK
jgi:hypothetical protein